MTLKSGKRYTSSIYLNSIGWEFFIRGKSKKYSMNV